MSSQRPPELMSFLAVAQYPPRLEERRLPNASQARFKGPKETKTKSARLRWNPDDDL